MHYQFTINLVEKQKKIEVKTNVKDAKRNLKKEVLFIITEHHKPNE